MKDWLNRLDDHSYSMLTTLLTNDIVEQALDLARKPK
jgi:hypothetical protein